MPPQAAVLLNMVSLLPSLLTLCWFSCSNCYRFLFSFFVLLVHIKLCIMCPGNTLRIVEWCWLRSLLRRDAVRDCRCPGYWGVCWRHADGRLPCPGGGTDGHSVLAADDCHWQRVWSTDVVCRWISQPADRQTDRRTYTQNFIHHENGSMIKICRKIQKLEQLN